MTEQEYIRKLRQYRASVSNSSKLYLNSPRYIQGIIEDIVEFVSHKKKYDTELTAKVENFKTQLLKAHKAADEVAGQLRSDMSSPNDMAVKTKIEIDERWYIGVIGTVESGLDAIIRYFDGGR
jgi:hypothetical protein